jgi:hypothetical protein
MKYLQYRDDFLNKKLELTETQITEQIESSEMLNEAFENDIRWGDSLVGRLINSVIRRTKTYINRVRIESVLKDLENELNALFNSTLSEDVKKNTDSAIINTLLTEIYQVVYLKEDEKLPGSGLPATVTNKAKHLVKDPGQIDKLIETLKQIGEIETVPGETKEDLIKKLEKLKELLTPLMEEAKDEREGKVEGEGSDKSPMFTFYVNVTNLFKSIISLDANISSKSTKLTEKPQLKVGGEYLYQDQSGQKKVVKIINLEHPVKRGVDKQWLTKDDEVEKQKVIKPKVYVVFRDVNGKYTSVTGIAVDSDKLSPLKKESIDFYQMESLPIFETAVIQKGETHATTAWKKVIKSWAQSGISNQVPKIKEVLEKSRSSEKLDKKILIDLGRQIVMNEHMWKDGKPIPFEELIKEEAGVIPSDYQEIPKAVTLVARVILAFKEDMGLLGALAGSPNNTGDTKKSLELFIKSYDKMKETFPKLKESESVKKEEIKKEFLIQKYNSFLPINEDEEIKAGDSEETNQETLETFEDEVMKAWPKAGFKKGEEDIWKKRYDQKTKDNLNKSVEDDLSKKKKIEKGKNADAYDHIIRIINIFGKAYKLYAVDEIPSGRLNGFISQKTFREYEFIGKGEHPKLGADHGPGYGPWASIIVLDKWDKGVMKLLEDPRYRKVLANTEFVSEAEESTKTKMEKPGSGKTLFTFINDMIGWNGVYRNFKEKRFKILEKYFGGTTAEESKDKLDDGEADKDPKIPESEIDKNALLWKKNIKIQLDDFESDPSNETPSGLKNTFLKIEYTDGEDKKGRYMIIFIDSFNRAKSTLFIKFHLHGGENSMVYDYFPNPWKKPSGLTQKEVPILFGQIKVNTTFYLKSGFSSPDKPLVLKYYTLGKNELHTLNIKAITNLWSLQNNIKNEKGENKTRPAKVDFSKVKKGKTDILDNDKLELLRKELLSK